jgi:hypothetical protein
MAASTKDHTSASLTEVKPSPTGLTVAGSCGSYLIWYLLAAARPATAPAELRRAILDGHNRGPC